jgi:hypothetical protein
MKGALLFQPPRRGRIPQPIKNLRVVIHRPERIQHQSLTIFIDLFFSGIIVRGRIVTLIALPGSGQLGQRPKVSYKFLIHDFAFPPYGC